MQTSDAILGTKGEKLPRFVSSEMTFGQSAAPVLKSVEYVPGTPGELQFVFDRPINAGKANAASTDVSLAKLDTLGLTSKDLDPVGAKATAKNVLGSAGEDVYTLPLTAGAEDDLAKATGTHTVTLYYCSGQAFL